MKAEKAQSIGLIDELASDAEDMLAKARAWIKANPAAQQPWDKSGYKMPGGTPSTPALAMNLPAFPANLRKQTKNANYPAPKAIMSAVVEGAQVDFDNALKIEHRYFVHLACGKQAKNQIKAFFFDLQKINGGGSRPSKETYPAWKATKVGVLGAGMMGQGIAYVAASVGVQVVLLDQTLEAAERGKAYTKGLLDKRVSKGRLDAAKAEATLALIQTTDSHADLKGCDIVIEAVFEDRGIKAKATELSEANALPDVLMCSNTSTLPITGLAQASKKPENYIGLHFFSPVDKMPLVEIIVGAETSDETLARGFDYVLQIGKTPIVVNDKRGFYTSRVFATYVMEGLAMVAEGVHPRSVEVAGMKAGMPMPPLALQDEVSLSLSLHISAQTRKDLAAEGIDYPAHPGEAVLQEVCGVRGRVGKKSGQGLYDYQGKDKTLWPGLLEIYPPKAEQPSQQDIIDRLMFIQANEAARCFEEKVVRSVSDTNIGSIFGWGFAPHQGGALQFINAMGAEAFVARSRELAQRHGARFEPAAIVVKMAQEGGRFEDVL